MTAVPIEPMTPLLDPAALTELADRLGRTRLVPTPDADWARGTPTSWLADLLRSWQAFDVPAFQRQLDTLSHLRADIDGQQVHVVVAEGRGPHPLPLLLTNGWPSSFCEYLDVLPLLTDPAAHGGDPADAFTVVLPTLPGYGFSAAPPAGGYSHAEVAVLWDRLMTVGLGHDTYVAHGSDLGAGVVSRLPGRSTAVAGIHLASPSFPLPPKPWSDAVQAYADEVKAWTDEHGSYGHQHGTKPSTVGAALTDSPAGLAAWIGEKFQAWSSRETRDLLLQTLTIYWATGTIATSLLPYWNNRHAPAEQNSIEHTQVPAAVGLFGGEVLPLPKPPRELAEALLAVSDWQEHDRGGHFPAAAEPELFAQTMRDVFRPRR